MSSTFSLVEVRAEHLDSPSKLHTAIHLWIVSQHGQKFVSRCISLQTAWACRPQFPISSTEFHLCLGSKPQTQLWSLGTAQLHWCNACHDTACGAINWPQLQVQKHKKKEFQCYLAYSGNSHFFENFIFFRISQITKFLSLRRLPTSKMSGFDIAPIYFQKHTKWAVFHILLPKNAERNFPNTSKLLPDGGQPMRNSVQMITLLKTYQMTKSAWPSWIFSCRRCTHGLAVRISHVLSCKRGLLVAFGAICCSCALHPLKQCL